MIDNIEFMDDLKFSLFEKYSVFFLILIELSFYAAVWFSMFHFIPANYLTLFISCYSYWMICEFLNKRRFTLYHLYIKYIISKKTQK